MSELLTAAIIARDAAATIEAAIASIIADHSGPIVLVDDYSSDATASLAQGIAGQQLTTVQPPQHIGTGMARQTALDHITTPYGLWLDADDAMLPGRCAAMLARLQAGADLVYEPCDLVCEDGRIDRLDIPDFLKRPGGMARNYERNWLPGLWGGFNTEFARTIGYDAEFEAAEDYDFLLRAMRAGANVGFSDHVGVRHYDRADTVSRQLDKTMMFTNRSRRKFTDADWDHVLASAPLGWLARAQVAIALEDYSTARLAVARKEARCDTDVAPYGKPARWIALYFTAVAAFCQQDKTACAAALDQADAIGGAAEILNMRGLLARRQGDAGAAQDFFNQALVDNPHYMDARVNRDDPMAVRLTPAPLRGGLGRNSY